MRALWMWPILTVAAATATGAPGVPTAQDIVDAYLALPIPAGFDGGEARGLRVETLGRLTAMPDAAVPVIAATLPAVDLEVHRNELIEILGRLPTTASAALLVSLLGDPDVGVRRQALSSLRLLAARIHRAGVVGVARGPDFPAQVGGLVPHLVAASEDDDDSVRSLALWALADTREPAAADALRARLTDPSARVRFGAACLLTEFGDWSGLPELRAALSRLAAATDRDAPWYYPEVQHLIVALERVTGVSLGESPPLPMLSSTLTEQAESARQFDALLQAWVTWWAARDAEGR